MPHPPHRAELAKSAALAAQSLGVATRSPVAGATEICHLAVKLADGGNRGDKTFTLSEAQSTMDTCTTPNVAKAVLLKAGVPPSGTDVFNHVVTITATPV